MRIRSIFPILCATFTSLALPPDAHAADTEKQIITASDAPANRYLGLSMDVDGTQAVIGAQNAAYVYEFDGTDWVEKHKLVASDGGSTWFGASVAIDGDVIVVGAIWDATHGLWSGAAYVFRYDGAQWNEEQKLTASDAGMYDWFGFSVAVSGDVLLVGQWDQNSEVGGAYVFRHSGTSWSEEQKLTASDGHSDNMFGTAVDLEANVALVGAFFAADVAPAVGAVYVFRSQGTTWTEEQKLVASDASRDARFGESVALLGARALVGAQGADAGYVFRSSGTVWSEEARIVASGVAPPLFGHSVALDQDVALVSGIGESLVFRWSGIAWTEEQSLVPSDAAPNTYFGACCALVNDMALVGDWGHDQFANESGAAYVYDGGGLVLSTSSGNPSQGDTLTFTTLHGAPASRVGLFLVDIDSVPTFVTLDLGTFDGAGTVSPSYVVPPGLTGSTMSFLSIGFEFSGRLDRSNRVVVSFQ